MNGVGFQLAAPSRGSGGKMPYTVEKALASGYAEAQGALVVVNNLDQFAACGADPSSIAGVTLTPGGTDTSGFNILGHKEFPPGYIQVLALRNEKFLAPFIGTIPTTPGGQFGVVRDTDGVWKIDFNDDINVVLTYLGIPDRDPSTAASTTGIDSLALCEFLGAVIQTL